VNPSGVVAIAGVDRVNTATVNDGRIDGIKFSFQNNLFVLFFLKKMIGFRFN